MTRTVAQANRTVRGSILKRRNESRSVGCRLVGVPCGRVGRTEDTVRWKLEMKPGMVSYLGLERVL